MAHDAVLHGSIANVCICTLYKCRAVGYMLVLLLSKALKAFGLYLMYDLLKLVHIVPFLFIVKAG